MKKQQHPNSLNRIRSQSLSRNHSRSQNPNRNLNQSLIRLRQYRIQQASFSVSSSDSYMRVESTHPRVSAPT